MKKLMIFSLAVVAAAAATFADQKPGAKRRPARFTKPTGGIIEKKTTGKVFRILNTTSAIPADKVAGLTKEIRYSALLPIEVVNGEKPTGCPFEAADNLVAQANVGAGVVIVDDAKLPMILVAPDRKWTILNVAQIKADAPSPEKLFERFNKLYWCAIARALGAGISSYAGCVLVPFSTVAEIDAIKATKPCPEPFNKMIDTGNAYGIKTLSIATYRTACEKGWAPQPTNDVQKAIWDEVHAIPQKPMKIEFDPKKGR